jgi:hypothetical protein
MFDRKKRAVGKGRREEERMLADGPSCLNGSWKESQPTNFVRGKRKKGQRERERC